MKLLKKIIIFILLSPVLSLAGGDFKVRVAIVDVQMILEQSLAIADIKRSINAISEKIQIEINANEVELKKLEQDLFNKKNLLSENNFKEEARRFSIKVSEVQKYMQNKKASLEQAHSNAVRKVHDTTIEIIREQAKKLGFNLVLPSSQILFAGEELNITSGVLSQLNLNLTKVDIHYNKE